MKNPQTISGYIREHLAELEAQAHAGFRQDFIVEQLAEKGFVVSLNNFRRLLYRARKKAATTLVTAPSIPQPPKEKSTTVKPKPNLTTGFNYTGTRGLDESDLV